MNDLVSLDLYTPFPLASSHLTSSYSLPPLPITTPLNDSTNHFPPSLSSFPHPSSLFRTSPPIHPSPRPRDYFRRYTSPPHTLLSRLSTVLLRLCGRHLSCAIGCGSASRELDAPWGNARADCGFLFRAAGRARHGYWGLGEDGGDVGGGVDELRCGCMVPRERGG